MRETTRVRDRCTGCHHGRPTEERRLISEKDHLCVLFNFLCNHHLHHDMGVL